MTRSGFKRVLLLAIFFIGIAAVNLYAAWWDLNRLPVPHRTEAVQKREPDLTSGSFEVIYYISALSSDELRDFYLKRLTDEGWQQKEPLEELSRISAPGLLPMASQSFSDCLIFEKDQETIIVRFTSLRNRSTRKDYNTNYIVSRYQRGDAESPYKPGPIPEVDSKFPPELLPDYPRATLVGMTEQDGMLYGAYHTSDGVKDASIYYRNNMPAFGWDLQHESPINKHDFPGVKSDKLEVPGRSFTVTQQKYVNEDGEECVIAISSMPVSADGPERTLVAVRYRP